MATESQSPLYFTLAVSDPRLDDEERESIAQGLFRQLRSAEETIAEVSRPQQEAPAGSKAVASTLIGVLAAVVSASSLKAFFAFLTERLRAREVTLEITSAGRKAKISVRSAQDLVVAYQAAAELLGERK